MKKDKVDEYMARALANAKNPFIKLRFGNYCVSPFGWIEYDYSPIFPEKTYLGHLGAEAIVYQGRISNAAYVHFFRYMHAVKLMGNKQNQLVLDLGCGVGSIGRMLYQDLRKPRYVGIDIDKRSLYKAVCRGYGFCPILFIKRDLYKPLPFFKNTFDFVYAYEIIEHLDEDGSKDLLYEIARVTKPGGIISISTPLATDISPKERAAKFRKYKKHAQITSGGGLDYHPYEWKYRDLLNFIEINLDLKIIDDWGLNSRRSKNERKNNIYFKFFPSDIARIFCHLNSPYMCESVLIDLRK